MSNGEYTAEILARLQKQQDAMQGLFSAVESALADIASPDRSAGVEQAIGAIESGIADLVATLDADKSVKALDRLTDAVAKINPNITVNVPQMPAVNLSQESVSALSKALRNMSVNVEAVIPPAQIHTIQPPATGAWELIMPGQYGAPDRKMTIKRIA